MQINPKYNFAPIIISKRKIIYEKKILEPPINSNSIIGNNNIGNNNIGNQNSSNSNQNNNISSQNSNENLNYFDYDDDDNYDDNYESNYNSDDSIIDSIYNHFIEKPYIDKLYLTEIDADIEGDTFFPEIPSHFCKTIQGKTNTYQVNALEFINYNFCVYSNCGLTKSKMYSENLKIQDNTI